MGCILDRAEKELEPLVKFSRPQFKTIDSGNKERPNDLADVNIAPALQQVKPVGEPLKEFKDKRERRNLNFIIVKYSILI